MPPPKSKTMYTSPALTRIPYPSAAAEAFVEEPVPAYAGLLAHPDQPVLVVFISFYGNGEGNFFIAQINCFGGVHEYSNEEVCTGLREFDKVAIDPARYFQSIGYVPFHPTKGRLSLEKSLVPYLFSDPQLPSRVTDQRGNVRDFDRISIPPFEPCSERYIRYPQGIWPLPWPHPTELLWYWTCRNLWRVDLPTQPLLHVCPRIVRKNRSYPVIPTSALSNK